MPEPTLANSDQLAAKLTNSIATGKILGRATAGTGAVEELTLGTNLSLSGTTLNAAGGTVDQSAIQTAITDKPAFRTDIGAMADSNTAVNAAIATNPYASRGAIGLRDVGFYDDFSRYTEGYLIGQDITSPLVGSVYAQNYNGPSAASMYTELGGLRCPVNSNNYLGSSIPTPNGILDMTFEFIGARPAGKYNENDIGFTFAFKESQIVTSGGIAVSGAIHINVARSAGVTEFSHFQQGTPVTYIGKGNQRFAEHPVAPLSGLLGSVGRWRVNIRAEGNRVEITSLGRTLVYESTAFAGRLANPTTWFYIQLNNVDFAGLPAPADRPYPRLERVWGNAPEITRQASKTIGSTSRFDGNPSAVYPNTIQVRPSDRPLVGNGVINGSYNGILEVQGATIDPSTNQLTGIGFYSEGKILGTFNGGVRPGVTPIVPLEQYGRTTVYSSPAGATLTTSTMFALPHLAMATGSISNVSLAGTFAANANTKEIAIRNNYGGWTTHWTSGPLAQNGGHWSLEYDVINYSGANRTIVVKFWSTSTGFIMANVSADRAFNLWDPLNVMVAATAAGDIQMILQKVTILQR